MNIESAPHTADTPAAEDSADTPAAEDSADENSPERLALCVAGMHRSGTSLTTSWLERCGLPVHGGRVVPAAVGNVKGHFEDLDFTLVNAAAIEKRWPDSEGWLVTSSGECPLEGKELSEALTLVASRRRSFQQWAWKDPRSTLLLGAWETTLPEMRTLLLWRPCAEVIDSLLRRAAEAGAGTMAHVDRPLAVGMWLAYNERVLAWRASHADTAVLVPIRSVTTAPERVYALLRERLGLDLAPVSFSSLYEERLLHAATPDDYAGRRAEVVALEERLAALSDA